MGKPKCGRGCLPCRWLPSMIPPPRWAPGSLRKGTHLDTEVASWPSLTHRIDHLFCPDATAVKAIALPAQESYARRLINVFWLSFNETRQLEAGMEPAPRDRSVLPWTHFRNLFAEVSSCPAQLPPPPQTELINVRLLVIMEREGETRMEKLLYINLCIINMLVIQLYTVFYSTIYHHTSRKAVSG